MKPKHELPVIDGALRVIPREYLADHKEIVTALARAQRFYLNEDASTKVGAILAQVEDLILDNHAFAIPPYETCYIEMNCRLAYKAAGKRGTAAMPAYSALPEDDVVGYLLDRRRMWVFARDIKGSHAVGPFRIEDSLGHASYWPDRKIACDECNKLGPEWGRLCVLLGSGVHSISDGQVREELLQRFTIHPSFPPAAMDAYKWWGTFQCSMGDLRNVLAVLLILNTPKHVTTTAQQPRPGIYKGRRVVFAAHRTVHIDLGERHDVRRLFHHPSGIRHKRHPVRGHFVHYHLLKGCIHTWPTIPEHEIEGSPSWRCDNCGGIRTWRKEHERGDASLGYVTHTYRVE